MMMVPGGEHCALHHIFEPFEIDDKAGDGVGFAGDGDLERVIVAVAIAVGAAAEDLVVLLGRPVVVPVVVRGGESGSPGEKDHAQFSSIEMPNTAGLLQCLRREGSPVNRVLPLGITRL